MNQSSDSLTATKTITGIQDQNLMIQLHIVAFNIRSVFFFFFGFFNKVMITMLFMMINLAS